MPGRGVVAVVVTYNRKEMLVDCLDALAHQTHPVAEVVLVDNASTDLTEQFVEASGLAERVPLSYVRLSRNGGGAEGFHYGVREALVRDSEWLWLMDDDCLPAHDCLERLLESPAAADLSTVVLAPAVRDPQGALLPVHRGRMRPGYLFAPLAALDPHDYRHESMDIEFSSFVGPLLRSSAARRTELPLRQAFIRFEDVEYLSRLARGSRMRLVPAGEIVHREEQPVTDAGFRGMWGDYAQRIAFSQQWKRLCGFRNLIFCGARAGHVTRWHALSYFAVQAVRTLMFHERRALTLWLLAMYGYDGWRGHFRNVPPSGWAGLQKTFRPIRYVNRTALRYGEDVAEPARRLRTQGAPMVTGL